MKQKETIRGALLGLLFFVLFTGSASAAGKGPQKVSFYEEGKAVSCTFRVELAVTPEEQAKGLMYRERLPQDSGMLFIFPKDEMRNFWMRNTLIPLDMIFVSSGLRVVSVHDFAIPKDETEISSRYGAKYVIEVNGGQAAACRIKAGTKVKFINSSR
jgi:uncharacterized protein